MSKIIKRNKRKGFTLIEISIALGLFGIIVSVTAGSYIQILRTQRQVTALIAANSNVSLVLEQMAREIRTSFEFSQPLAVTEELTFTNKDLETITYRLNTVAKTLERQINLSAFEPITADNIEVVNLDFLGYGQAFINPLEATRIVILLSVKPIESTLKDTVIHLQTTISPRFQ